MKPLLDVVLFRVPSWCRQPLELLWAWESDTRKYEVVLNEHLGEVRMSDDLEDYNKPISFAQRLILGLAQRGMPAAEIPKFAEGQRHRRGAAPCESAESQEAV